MQITSEEFGQFPINKELCNFYKSMICSLDVSETTKELLSAPFLMQASLGYVNNPDKSVFIVGQESHGWGGNSIGFSYSSFLKTNNREQIMMENQTDFVVDQYERNSSKGKPLWEAIRNIIHISNDYEMPSQPYLWANLMASDYDGGSFIKKLSTKEEISFVEFSKKKFIGEISILKPKICILLTGPDYDFVVEKFFNLPSDWKNTDIRSLKECSDPSMSDLIYVKTFVWNGCRFFRTYHPRHLRLKNKWHIIDVISKTVKNILQ